MLVTLLANRDHANLGYLYAESLRRTGVDAMCLKDKKSDLMFNPEAHAGGFFGIIIDRVKKSDVVIFMHSEWLDGLPLNGQKIGVFHTGELYRQRSAEINSTFNGIVHFSMIRSNDLLGKGAKNEILLEPPVDTDQIYPLVFHGGFESGFDETTFAHYPDDIQTKGSDIINDVCGKELSNSECIYLYDPKPYMWQNNLRRMSRCDVYIERFGNEHGTWGMSYLEAQALGRIVITDIDKAHLAETIKDLAGKSKTELQIIKAQHREWVEHNHSLQVVGEKFKAILESL